MQVSAGLSEAARAAAGRCEHRGAASPATRRRASSGCNLAGASRSARRPCSGVRAASGRGARDQTSREERWSVRSVSGRLQRLRLLQLRGFSPPRQARARSALGTAARALLVPPLCEPAIVRRSTVRSAVPGPGVHWGLHGENAAAAGPRREAAEERRDASEGLAICTPLPVAVRSSPGCYLPGE